MTKTMFAQVTYDNVPDLKSHFKEIEALYLAEDYRLSQKPSNMLRRSMGVPEQVETGHPFVICFNIAKWLKKTLFPLTGKVMGFWSEQNPTSLIGKLCDGHDFLVVGNRYIVDFWYTHIEMEKGAPSIVDMETEPELVAKYYGDKKTWRKSE